MTSDDLLRDAARQLREHLDGRVSDPDCSRARILGVTAARQRRQRRWRWLAPAAVLACGSIVSAAWAAETGRLRALLTAVVGTVAPRQRSERPMSKDSKLGAPPLEASSAPSPSSAPTPSTARTSVPEVTPAETATASRPPPRVSRRRGPADRSGPGGTAEPDREDELFKSAYRDHFLVRNPQAALAGWDAYLAAAPDGRYALEASYNRALCLVRLRRLEDAVAALRPFAEGAHGEYRRRQAARLIDVLSRGKGS